MYYNFAFMIFFIWPSKIAKNGEKQPKWCGFPKLHFFRILAHYAIGKRSLMASTGYKLWRMTLSFTGKMLKRSAKTSQNGRAAAADFLMMVIRQPASSPHLISFRHSLKQWWVAQQQ